MNFRRYRELKRKGKARAIKSGSQSGLLVTGHDPDDGSELSPVFIAASMAELQALEAANRNAADELAELIKDIESLD